MCADCGCYVGATAVIEGARYAILNVRGVDLPGFDGREPEPMVYDGESLREVDPRARSLQEYKDAAGVNEGMDGISTRFAFKVLAATFNHDTVEVAADLGAAVKAATAGADTGEIELESIGGNLIVRSKHGDTASAECSGEAPTIVLFAKLLLGALTGCGETVTIRRSEASPGPLLAHDDGYVAMLMPIQLDAAQPRQEAA